MGFQIKSAHTRETYATAPTLSAARHFCCQRLLKASKDRQGFLSDLAAGLIVVYDAKHESRDYVGPGF